MVIFQGNLGEGDHGEIRWDIVVPQWAVHAKLVNITWVFFNYALWGMYLHGLYMCINSLLTVGAPPCGKIIEIPWGYQCGLFPCLLFICPYWTVGSLACKLPSNSTKNSTYTDNDDNDVTGFERCSLKKYRNIMGIHLGMVEVAWELHWITRGHMIVDQLYMLV